METEQLEIRCDDCGATLTMPAHRFAAVCPFCASPSVVDRPAGESSARREPPDFILGFVIDRAEAERRVKAWIGRSRFFAPSALKQAKVHSVEGIYLPVWLYGCIAHSQYEARIGEDYTTTESYTTTDSKGRTVHRTRTVTKTEWRELSGTHASYVLDVLVTASKGLDNAELETIEPFDLRAMRRYDPAIVSGWAAEEATLSRDEGHELARSEALEFIEDRIEDFLPGDSSSLQHFDSRLSSEDTDLVLLPIWVFAARYGPNAESLRILINGQTGEVQGKVPRSIVKIVAGSLLGLLAVALIFLLGLFALGVIGSFL
ncbi:MAG: hypothetical protein H6831_03805 [Planctomycetes bacterium]|nr:hypothetical protein [Planctomycetota bacterium]MCB9903511.1 hypothetical protein [Planctomycetota bacterium]